MDKPEIEVISYIYGLAENATPPFVGGMVFLAALHRWGLIYIPRLKKAHKRTANGTVKD